VLALAIHSFIFRQTGRSDAKQHLFFLYADYGFCYAIFDSYDITMMSAMASLAIACLLDSRSGGT
jgi:hypothetical protein